MSNLGKISLLCVLCALVGFGSAYFFLPSKIVEITKTVSNTDKHNNIITVTIKKPDGSSETTSTDHSTETSHVDTSSSKTTEYAKPNLLLGASYLSALDGKRTIVGTLQKRLFGNVFVGVTGTSTGYYGLGLTLVF